MWENSVVSDERNRQFLEEACCQRECPLINTGACYAGAKNEDGTGVDICSEIMDEKTCANSYFSYNTNLEKCVWDPVNTICSESGSSTPEIFELSNSSCGDINDPVSRAERCIPDCINSLSPRGSNDHCYWKNKNRIYSYN